MEERTLDHAAGIASIDQFVDLLQGSLWLDDPASRPQNTGQRHFYRLAGGVDNAVRPAFGLLAKSLGRGVRQYVILGAVLDTFAYRQPAWSSSIRIYEFDHHRGLVNRTLVAEWELQLP